MNWKKILKGSLVVIVIILFVLLQSYLSGKGRNAVSKPTTYDEGINGHKVFYILLEKMGYKTRRFTYPLEDLEKENQASLLIIEPYSNLVKEGDSTKLIDWVRRGNRILLVTEMENPVLNALDVKLEVLKMPEKKMPRVKGGLMKNVGEVDGTGNVRLGLSKQHYRVLLEDELGVIAASIKYGGGEILVCSSPEIFNNSMVSKTDNVILATNLIKHLGKEDVLFDEAYHGHIKHGSIFVMPSWARALILQLGLLLILFYLAAMRRFGKPRKLVEEVLRTSTEYIYSLAELFKKAETTRYAAENNVRGFKRRISRSIRLSPEASNEKILEALKYIPGVDEGKVAHILEKCCQAGKESSMTEAQLLRLCRDLEAEAGKITG